MGSAGRGGEREGIKLVSVIVPSYRHRPYLVDRIESIVNQSYPRIELIVLDDGSDDGSAELLRDLDARYSFKVTDLSPDNGGSPYRQWLKGIGYAAGDYVWIAESDDLAAPEFLAALAAALEAVPEAAFATAAWDHIGPTGEGLGCGEQRLPLAGPVAGVAGVHRVDSEGLLRRMVVHNPLENVSSLLMRTERLRAASSGLEDFRYLGDWFAYLRLLRQGPLLYVDRLLSSQRAHGETTRTRRRGVEAQALFYEEMMRVTREALLLVGAGPEERCAAYERVLFHAEWRRTLEQRLRGAGERIAIYGAGAMGRQLYGVIRELRPEIEVAFFVDAKAAKETAMVVEGVPVIDPEKLLKRAGAMDGIIIASNAFYDEILGSLTDWGLHELVINHP